MKRLFVLLIVLMLAACSSGENSDTSTAPEGQEHTFDSLKAAMSSGLGMKCTFAYEGSTGEALVKGDSYHTTVRAQGQLAHSVSDGETMWVWMEGQKEGIMITPEELEESNATRPEYGMFDEEQKLDFTCLPYPVSGTSFQPPSDIKFITITQMMEAMFSDW